MLVCEEHQWITTTQDENYIYRQCARCPVSDKQLVVCPDCGADVGGSGVCSNCFGRFVKRSRKRTGGIIVKTPA